MKYLKIVIFLCIGFWSAAVLYAAKDKEPPPWMEDIKIRGRSTYLVPKGAKRKVIGSQVIVEPPNEYVARRLYEMEKSLEERFAQIEKNQEELKSGLEEIKKSINKVKKDQKEIKNQAFQK